MEDQHPSANNTRDTEGEGEDQYSPRMHRVPELVRFNKHNEEDYYAPKMVSFGPYYHGLKEFGMAEKFEHEVLKMFVSSSGKSKESCHCQIFKVIDKIRNCYVGVSRDAYDDRTLAEMILLDASFAIYLMKISAGDFKKYYHFCQHLGRALLKFAFQDLCLLDNQIPLWVIELLTNLIYGNEEEGPMLISEFLSYYALQSNFTISITGEDKKKPLHLVAALHQLLVELDNEGEKPSSYCLKNINFKFKCLWWPWKNENPYALWVHDAQPRPVTDLKAKGIHFKRSSYDLKNIKFRSYKFYGQLQLPVWHVDAVSKQLHTQLIAYEALQESNVGMPIICNVNFLKSLIVKSEDVKELREKKILINGFDNDEQVVEVIKGINTWGLHDTTNVDDVRVCIEKHCSSKAKTWIAELINTYFRSPWTFTALVAANLFLCLTFLQTYYTMNLPK
ncbi:UPF0481 protein At3g47200-like [Olea europaea var. sylvestris]|uniref:UPF0481 protein At3g47200-like n=1 Tax=Olea europaea var. sylvestris TaxID=158386 RepID=UPI000C1CF4D1|nr:UPF0481 protein At3g47200-like [Olea europaea var. sylvestris]